MASNRDTSPIEKAFEKIEMLLWMIGLFTCATAMIGDSNSDKVDPSDAELIAVWSWRAAMMGGLLGSVLIAIGFMGWFAEGWNILQNNKAKKATVDEKADTFAV